MKRPFGKELDRLYESFREDHSRLRRDLLASLPDRDAIDEGTGRDLSGSPSGGKVMLNRIVKIAAAIVVATIVVGVIGHFAGSKHSSGTAFGQVLAHIRNSTYTFDLTTTAEGQTAGAGKGMVRQPGRIRIDDPAGKVTSIADLTTGKHVLLFHAQKAAMMEIPHAEKLPDGPGPFAMFSRPVESLWNLQDGTEKSRGEKEIDGQSAVGFEVHQDTPEYACDIIVWARKDSGRPIRVEMNLYDPQNRSQSVTMVMSHFDLDVELDEGLFSLEPPAGYTAAHQKTLDETPADTPATPEGEKIEQALRLWTDGNKDKAIETLLSVNWAKPMAFSPKAYLFAMTEKAFIALKLEDQNRVRQEAAEAAGQLRKLVIAIWDLARTERSNRNYARAEMCLETTLNVGKMISDNHEGMLAFQLLGPAIQKKTLEEMKILYQETNRVEDLARVEEQIKAADALRESILQRVRDQ